MPRKFTFSTKESSGQEYVIAQPRTEAGEPVRLAADWIAGDEVEGEWERAVRAIIKNDLMDGMELEEGQGQLSRRRAVEVLAEATDDDGAVVTGEKQAEALLEYFADQGILEMTNGRVVLLKNPDEDELAPEMMLNWAASIDACVEKIDETIERIQAAKEKLQDHKEKLQTDSSGIEERLQETAQELRSLGDGPGVPENPRELPEAERKRYDRLKRELIYHRQMQQVDQRNVVGEVEAGTDELAQNISMLNSARDALDRKRQEVRQKAMKREIFPRDAIGIVENMGNLASQLANLGNVDEKVESADPEEITGIVDEVLGPTQQVAETAQQTAGEEERTDESTEYHMQG